MNKKAIPKFKNLAEEKDFWATHDTTDYVDWSKAKKVTFPHLKPSTKTISLRLPKILLQAIKQIANKKDIPYQSYIKMILSESVDPTHSFAMKVVPLSEPHHRGVKRKIAKKTKKD
jgi:predicted DNA binding CopG/RHH family protein